MFFRDYLNKNKFFLIAIFLYILITFPAMINHIPWYDEVHAYFQAYFMNLDNCLDILRAEGHPSLWFLIIMPFAKLKWHYPYPMLIINYISCLAAIIVLWKKSNFSFLIKFTITFSSMFIFYFPIVARGYSTGILFLFLLAALYKDKLNHPILYPVLVFLTLNLNIMCGIGASWFGLVFFIELLKSNLNKKIKIISILILVLAVIIPIFPFLYGIGAETSYQQSETGPENLIKFFLRLYGIRAITYIIALITIFIKTHKCIEQTFIVYTLVLLLCLFGIFYPGYAHHFIFFFIYLFIFLWIYNITYSEKENIFCINNKIDFMSILLMLIFLFPLRTDILYVFQGNRINTKAIAHIINTQPEYRNSVLYLRKKYLSIAPYLKDDVTVYNPCNIKPLSWDSYYSDNCVNKIYFTYDKNSFLITKNKIPNLRYVLYNDLYIFQLK